jgi:serine/threonine-protein kinase RsbW
MKDNETTRTFYDVALGDLAQIRHFVRETAVTCACGAGVLDELIVAINEAVSNIVRHGYKKAPGEIKVTVMCGDDTIKVILHDRSLGFDPMLIPSPDTTLPLAERPFGGLGLHMMRAFCDELSYRRDSQNGNELTLLKRFGQ